MSASMFKPGDRVRIPAGTLVHSMRDGKWISLARAQTVLVDHIISGGGAEAPMVSWAGSGGYWKRAHITDDMTTASKKEVLR